MRWHQRNHTGKREKKEQRKERNERTKEIEARPLARFRGCHERGHGEKQRLFLTLGASLDDSQP